MASQTFSSGSTTQPALLIVLLFFLLLFSNCTHIPKKQMEVTAYCGCGKCCGWTRGSWKYLKINFWNRYYHSGKPYHGLTASGTKPRQYNPGLFSKDSLAHPWMIPVRMVFFPWLFFSHTGTIAADTKYYPFGTIMYIPKYGKAIVEDRGSAIKGPGRIDVFFNSHRRALEWGRQQISVEIKKQ